MRAILVKIKLVKKCFSGSSLYIFHCFSLRNKTSKLAKMDIVEST